VEIAEGVEKNDEGEEELVLVIKEVPAELEEEKGLGVVNEADELEEVPNWNDGCEEGALNADGMANGFAGGNTGACIEDAIVEVDDANEEVGMEEVLKLNAGVEVTEELVVGKSDEVVVEDDILDEEEDDDVEKPPKLKTGLDVAFESEETVDDENDEEKGVEPNGFDAAPPKLKEGIDGVGFGCSSVPCAPESSSPQSSWFTSSHGIPQTGQSPVLGSAAFGTAVDDKDAVAVVVLVGTIGVGGMAVVVDGNANGEAVVVETIGVVVNAEVVDAPNVVGSNALMVLELVMVEVVEAPKDVEVLDVVVGKLN
jgi:hypothetical protein